MSTDRSITGDHVHARAGCRRRNTESGPDEGQSNVRRKVDEIQKQIADKRL